MAEINRKFTKLFISCLLTFMVGAAAHADSPAVASPDDFQLLSEFLEPEMVNTLEVLDDEIMAKTRGELWPLVGAIGAVVSVDLALQAYFFGVYVPAMSTTTHYTATAPVFR